MPKPKEIFLKDYKVPTFLIKNVELFFDIFDDYTIVRNVSSFHKNLASKDNSSTLKLDAENMEIMSVKIDDKILDKDGYTFLDTENVLEIKNVPKEFTLETEVKIYPHLNKELAGLYKSDSIFCTQCEPLGFRRITPHLDRPDIMSKFKVSITADKKALPILLSNGNPIKSGDLEKNRHFVVWEDPIPKPNYLFALVAGDLVRTEDSFATMSGKVVPLYIYTEEKDKHRTAHAMESLKKSMKWDEERFGREYDLDIFMIVAVDAFNSGAMENKGLNIFNTSAILCDSESSTDANYKYIERVVAHEYFHNWTGDRITCRDWFQLTLKEGLTVFRDSEFSADIGDRDVKRIQDADYLKEYQFSEDGGPMAHPIKPASFIQIENFYTRTVYDKGSEVIRMLFVFLGHDGFRKGMDKYFELFDGKAVTTEDFISAFEVTSGRDFTQFKDSWYAQAGTPEISFKENFDKEKSIYRLTISQKNNHPSAKIPYHFPIEFGLIDPQNGEDLDSGILEITKEEETFEFNINKKPIPSLLRGFSAPVKLTTEFGLEKDLFLFQHDKDSFNRFEAGKRLSKRLISDLMSNLDTKIPQQVIESYRKLLTNKNLSESFRAECLGLPGLYSLVSNFKIYDYKGAFDARKKYANIIADNLEEDLLDTYQSYSKEKYAKSDDSMARRTLKNACLTYLSYATKDYTSLIYNQFQTADNMTDQMVALSLLCNNESQEKEKALEDFYEKWKSDSLVMNKWFAVQAMAKSNTVIENLKKLEKDPAFDGTNPNKIRSLFGAFGKNYPFFHDAMGTGYQYLADKILEVDKFNKKASGSLAKSFEHFQYLSPEQKKFKAAALDRILEEKNISDALFEVVDRIRKSGK